MIEASACPFVETKEYRRFREFCDACRRYRYIGLCYGPPGVGKTLSARHYADWDRIASADPYTGHAAFRSDEVPGHGCVLYTAAVVSSPRRIEDEIARLRRKLRDLILQAVRGEAEPGIAAARQALEYERDRPFVCHDWLTGKPERLRRAEAAASQAVDEWAARSRGVGDPTELLLVDEVDRLKMSGLEQLRALFDGGGVGLVLIGMPGLERRLARYAQLSSRIGFVHEFRPLGAAEVRTLLAGWRPAGVPLPEDLLADAEAVAAIIRITGGNFRLLDRLLTQVGRILALNGLGVVTRAVVEAARAVLVIGAA